MTNKCNGCGRDSGSPYRVYDAYGKVINGCVDAFHTGHLVTPSESSFWHNRPAAKKIRADMKKFIDAHKPVKRNPKRKTARKKTRLSHAGGNRSRMTAAMIRDHAEMVVGGIAPRKRVAALKKAHSAKRAGKRKMTEYIQLRDKNNRALCALPAKDYSVKDLKALASQYARLTGGPVSAHKVTR